MKKLIKKYQPGGTFSEDNILPNGKYDLGYVNQQPIIKNNKNLSYYYYTGDHHYDSEERGTKRDSVRTNLTQKFLKNKRFLTEEDKRKINLETNKVDRQGKMIDDSDIEAFGEILPDWLNQYEQYFKNSRPEEYLEFKDNLSYINRILSGQHDDIYFDGDFGQQVSVKNDFTTNYQPEITVKGFPVTWANNKKAVLAYALAKVSKQMAQIQNEVKEGKYHGYYLHEFAPTGENFINNFKFNTKPQKYITSPIRR